MFGLFDLFGSFVWRALLELTEFGINGRARRAPSTFASKALSSSLLFSKITGDILERRITERPGGYSCAELIFF